MINVIADRYAQALFEVGEETQTTSELYQELSELVDIFNENKDLYNFLKSPLIGREDKKNVMQNIFKNQLSNSMNNFLKLVIDKDRISAIENMKESYKSLLNADGTGMIGYITIPSIDCKLAIYHTVDASVLQVGAGHLEGSSLPVGGKGTHAVLSSHRGLPSAKLFTDLNLVEKGDVFYLHILDKTLAYEVDQIQTVLPEQTDSLAITEGKDYVTLVTCTPYAVNTHRILVRGHRTTVKAAKTVQKSEKKATGISNPTLPMLILCVVIGIVIAAVLVAAVNFVQNKKRRRK